ncbi:MAG: cation-translocating P-type ATPase, partial [Phycisphaeraceae bacterium]|nr:cation-translocating P-type ATPase [Phycisphaeraceae bacterium]
ASRIGRTLAALGYRPHPVRDRDRRQVRKLEERRHLLRIGLAGALAGNVMLVTWALYAGFFEGMGGADRMLFRWMAMTLGLVALAGPGAVFFRGAWASLRTRTPHMDLPIATALLLGAAAGVAATVRGPGEIYFDSLAALVFLLLVGRWLQATQQRRAADAVALLNALTPVTAHRLVNGVEEEVEIDDLSPDQIVRVRAGETLPVDGTIVNGRSAVDQSLLSGESKPVAMGPGDQVCAGAVNAEAPIEVRISELGANTRAGRLMALIERAARDKPPLVQMADRLAVWFAVGVPTLALGTLIVWSLIDPSRAVSSAVALMIVACPCALGLATPLSIAVAIGRAARRRIMVKGGAVLEKLAKPGTVIFDKTGTLSGGRVTLVDWFGDRAVRSAVERMQRDSCHPVGRALAEGLAAQKSFDQQQLHRIRHDRSGVEAVWEGRPLAVGSVGWIGGRASVPKWAEKRIEQLTVEGYGPVLVALDRRVVAVAAVGDAIRPEARAVVHRWKAAGWKTMLLSGDHVAVVDRVARQAGVDEARADQSPEQKAAAVAAVRRAGAGSVVMVGDGVNDAAALAEADVGVAVHGGAEASLAAADVFVGRPGLEPLDELLSGSRRLVGTIRRAMGLSLAYNLIGVAAAAVGWVGPLTAAVLMPVSSLTVLSVAVGSRTFGDRSWPSSMWR